MTDEALRTRVIEIAQNWIDTPYQHQASVRGGGCDCLGLLRGIWREIYGMEPTPLPPYSADWAERGAGETLLEAARTYLAEIPKTSAQAGDVLAFRMQGDAAVKHVAIRSGPTTIIHAYWGRSVVESFLVPFWQRRWSHSFRFPNRE